MKNTVDKATFQAVKVVEFLAMPKSYRFDKTGRDGKFFKEIPHESTKKISQYISNRPKLGGRLFVVKGISIIKKNLRVYKRSNIFKKFQFKIQKIYY